ncbi:MAG: ATP-binding cassette domain-containing protein, partial [Candidatus Aminicenantes bacterium]|nr:ATP-binding cassette domain-containing protein [Candidatus Aminicenantes bacterium]
MDKNLIEINGLDVFYGKKRAVNNINLNFRKGETVLIAGRNGAGKSTFLRALGQLILPDNGSVNYYDLSKKKIGIITDKMSMFENLTLEEGIKFHTEIFGIEKFDHTILDHLGMDMKRKISALSSGERAIYHLSLLISQKPELLLIDEVFYLVDPYIRDIFIETLIGLLDGSNTTIIMVNHTFADTGRIPERVIIMDEGEIIIDEERETLLSKVKKISSDMPEPVDLPVFFSRNTPFGSEYFIFPYDKEMVK